MMTCTLLVPWPHPTTWATIMIRRVAAYHHSGVTVVAPWYSSGAVLSAPARQNLSKYKNAPSGAAKLGYTGCAITHSDAMSVLAVTHVPGRAKTNKRARSETHLRPLLHAWPRLLALGGAAGDSPSSSSHGASSASKWPAYPKVGSPIYDAHHTTI